MAAAYGLRLHRGRGGASHAGGGRQQREWPAHWGRGGVGQESTDES